MVTSPGTRAHRRRRSVLLAVCLAAMTAGMGGGWLLTRAPDPVPAGDVQPGLAAATPASSPEAGPTARATLPPAEMVDSPVPGVTATAPPVASGPTARPVKVPTTRVATRVVVGSLGIDLPVMRQTTPYPACGVAMYILELDQPGAGTTGATYLYAHAQTGNFLPLLKESLVNDGLRMLGMVVDVYTGDSLKFTYQITDVRRHVTSMDAAFDWSGPESIWLQTSEGQGAAVPKLQVVGELRSRVAADYAASHPVPRPVSC